MEFADRNMIAMLFGLTMMLCGNHVSSRVLGYVVIAATSVVAFTGWQP